MTTKYIICPDHGKHIVRVEEKKHIEFFSTETALCPKCKKRFLVQSENE